MSNCKQVTHPVHILTFVLCVLWQFPGYTAENLSEKGIHEGEYSHLSQ